MKKSKMALAAVVATIVGTSALGLAACSEDTDKTDKPTPAKGVYTITFDANGGSYASTVTTPVERKTANGRLLAFPQVSPNAPAGTDYSFKGWGLSPSATEADKLDTKHEYDRDTTVYAIWGGTVDPGTGAYLVTFNPNGGTITSGSSTMTTVNGVLTGTLPTATRGDDTFLGWYKEKDSTDASKKVTANETTFTEPTTVYASWQPQQSQQQEHEITFDAKGGKIDGADTKKITTVGGVIATLPVPDLAGSTFLGWFTQENGGGTQITTIYPFDAGITVYAHWGTLTGNTYIVGGKSYNLTDREGWLKDQEDDRDRMYSIGSNEELGVDLQPGDEISFKIDGEPIVFFVTKDSKGVAEAGTSTEVSKITINAKKAANFVFYLAHYPPEGRDKACWSVTVVADVEGDDPIVTPDGATATIGSTAKAMSVMTFTAAEMETNGHKDVELQLLNETIAKNTDISFTYDGKAVSFGWFRGDSAATSATLTDDKTTSIKTLADGRYSIYLQHYTAANEEGEHWYIVAKLDVKQTGLTAATALTANDWYLTGDMTEFGGLYTEYHMTYNETKGEYQLEVELPAYTAVKLVNGDKTQWVGEYKMWSFEEEANADYMIKGSNVAILQAGKYGFYYNIADKLIYVSRITEGGGGGGGQQETDKAPGLYVGDTKLQAWASHNDSEVKLEKVKIEADSTLTFVYGGKVVVPAIKESNGAPCTDKIVEKDGALYCKDGGVFDMYYEFGANQIWIEYKGQYTAPATDLGGLAINGTIVHSFKLNEGGFNEVYVGDTDTVLATQTEFTIMYGGADVTSQVTLKKDSKGSIKNGKLIVPAGSFKFYYDYAAKELYIGGTIDVSQSDPNEALTYESTQTATAKTQAYITGKINGKSTSFDWQNGYRMTYDASGNYGNGEYTITIYLKAGDEVKVRCKDSDSKGGYDFISNYTGNVAPGLEHVEKGTTNSNAIVINDDGYYTFYYKDNYESNGLWLVYTAA